MKHFTKIKSYFIVLLIVLISNISSAQINESSEVYANTPITVSQPDLGGNYGNNQMHKWEYYSYDGYPIALSVNAIDLGPGDYIYIYDNFIYFDGVSLPPGYVDVLDASSSAANYYMDNAACGFIFTSDASITATGFSATIEALEADYVFCDEYGSAFNYPTDNQYETNTTIEKRYILEDNQAMPEMGSSQSVMQINISSFDIGNGTLYAYNGLNDNSPLIGTYTMNNRPSSISTTGKYLYLKLITGSQIANGLTTNVICKQRRIMVDTYNNAVFSQENYSDNYERLVTYYTYDEENKIKADFIGYFYIADDYLRIYDGDDITATLIGEYTQTEIPELIISSSNSLTFHFLSNTVNSGVGWNADIIAISEEPEAVDCDNGTPLYYPISDAKNSDFPLSNKITYVADAGATLTANILNFSMNNGGSLEIYDDLTDTRPALKIMTLSGTQSLLSIASTGQYLTFKYNQGTVYEDPNDSWNIKLSCNSIAAKNIDCGGSGTVYQIPLNWDGTTNYANETFDIQTFTSSTPGKQLKISFHEFSLEEEYDYLYIYDGDSEDAEQIAALTGNALPKAIYSSKESITLKFQSDYSVTETGVKALIECFDPDDIPATVINCNIPTTISENFTESAPELIKVFRANDANKILNITFNSLDFGPLVPPFNQPAYILSVEIFDGFDINSSPLTTAAITNADLPITFSTSGKFVTLRFKSSNGTVLGQTANYEISCDDLLEIDEYNALVALYNSTDGDNWKKSWNLSASPISWYGVAIKNKKVKSIRLTNNKLAGQLPHEMNNFSNLEYLDLTGNQLFGEIPALKNSEYTIKEIALANNFFTSIEEFWIFQPVLEKINLSSNLISDDFPEQFAFITTLKELYLNNNKFTGNLPEYYDLPSLEVLNVSSNKLSGRVPRDLFLIATLKTIDLSSNNFAGTIPTNINSLGYLEELKLNNNNFTGEIPYNINLLASLKELNLSNNLLNGKIPNVLYNLDNLSTIDLSINNITGTLSSAIESLTSLLVINLSENKLSGILPPELGYLFKINAINLSNNNFSGTLPAEYGYLSSLTTLNLAGNNIYGTLPDELQFLEGIKMMDLSNNNFSGEITFAIDYLKDLKELKLSDNNFSGSLPNALPSLTKLSSIDVSGNNFDKLPDFAQNILGGKLSELNVSDNALTFDDILLNINYNISFKYNPQAEVGTQYTFTLEEGDNLLLNVTIAGDGNNFVWKKNGAFTGEENNIGSYNITDYTDSQSGTYLCEITNPNVPDLVLLSKPIEIKTYIGSVHTNDKNALIDLFYSTDGDFWKQTWDINTDPRTWKGVTINSSGRVTAIDLSSNNLWGTIPESFGDLTKIRSIDFSDNWLEGNLPSTIGQLSELKTLNIQSNRLEGEMVVGVKQLSALEVLNIGQNDFSGDLVNLISTNTKLKILIANNNSFSGVIPASLALLTNLKEIDLSGNLYSGNIPAEIGSMTNLNKMLLNNNRLEGSIPTEIGMLNKLTHIELQNNKLTGSIPEEIGNISILEMLKLNNNTISGSIPSNIFKLYNAQVINLSNNDLNGSLQNIDMELYNIVELNLSKNKLSGNIPSLPLSSLEKLNLANNNFTGNIPREISYLDNITELDLSNNMFEGTLSQDFIEMSSLEKADFSSNAIVDIAPNEASNSSFLPATYLYEFNVANNKLTFEDLEPYTGTDGFTYSPQANINQILSFNVTEETMLSFNIVIGGTHNSYQWYKNGDPIDNKTDRVFIPSATFDDAGIYSCIVKNTNVEGLAIYSNDIPVKVDTLFRSIAATDKAALIALYNATNGKNWDVKWDLTQAVSSWQGVRYNYLGKITELILPNNNLNGTLPPEMGNLTSLKHLDLSNNNLIGDVPNGLSTIPSLEEIMLQDNFLTSIPTFSLLFDIERLNITNNLIDFAALEKNAEIEGISYSPQRPMGRENVTIKVGENYILSFNIGGTANTYSWEKEGRKLDTDDGSSYTLSNVLQNDGGRYRCRIENYFVPNISLEYEFFVNVEKTFDANDLNVLQKIYDTNGGTGWQDGFNLKNKDLWPEIKFNDYGFVETIDLSGNNLTGELPEEIGQLSALKSLKLSNNNLSGSLPEDMMFLDHLEVLDISNNQLSDISIANFIFNISNLKVANNRLKFSDLESFISIKPFVYEPQPNSEQKVTITGGNNYVLKTNDNASNNIYNWSKDGVALEKTTASLSITDAGLIDKGQYTCIVNNPSLPNLTMNYGFEVDVLKRKIVDQDSLALLAIYEKTNGDNWNTTWILTSNVTDWIGVQVNYRGRVTALDLSSNNLTGTLPNQIGDLTEMRNMRLSNNKINGQLPATIGKLKKMVNLYLNNNNFTEAIPDGIFKLNKLNILGLNNNSLSGTLNSDAFDYLENIELLNLSSNSLTGTLPLCTVSLPLLTDLMLHNNEFSGTVPEDINKQTALNKLYLYNNNLTGNLYQKFDKLLLLQELRLDDNDFTGNISSDWGELSELATLNLEGNLLSGEIPAQLGKLLSLSFLNIANNKLSGTIPNELSNLVSLEEVYLNGNEIENLADFSQLKFLNRFYIQNNKLMIDDLEHLPQEKISDLVYWQQDSIYTNETITINEYEPFDITSTVSGSSVQYHWYRNNTLLTANESIYSVNIARLEDEGYYKCVMTSPLLPMLKLERKNVNVKVVPKPVIDSDRNALIAFYEATNGDNWTTKTNWNKRNTLVKDWYGVTVENGRVIALDLSLNGLSGELPESLGELTALQQLNLNNNQIGGKLPESIVNLSSLKTLDLSWNSFYSEIQLLADLSNIRTINLASNNFYGNLFNDWSKLNKLRSLSLANNNLNGELNQNIGDATMLSVLKISNNKIYGPIPQAINKLVNLTELYLDANSLSGNVPDIDALDQLRVLMLNQNLIENLPNLTLADTLTEVNVSNNKLEFDDLEPNISIQFFQYNPQAVFGQADTIIIYEGLDRTLHTNVGGAYNKYVWKKINTDPPTETGANADLTFTNVDSSMEGIYRCFVSNTLVGELNLLSETIKVVVSNDSLALVDLYNATNGAAWENNSNWLQNDAPLASWYGVYLDHEGHLISLKLPDNNLTGTLPEAIGDMTKTRELIMHNNYITSNLPSKIGNLSELQILNFQNNQLNGELPLSITNLSNIRSLNLSQNKLEGTIPSAISNYSNAIVLNYSNNLFTGLEQLNPAGLQNLQMLSVTNNMLTFEDIEPNFDKLSGFAISPQKDIPLSALQTSNLFSCTAGAVGGTVVEYAWKHNNADIENGLSQNTLVIENYEAKDEGDYHCEIQSKAIGNNLILRTETKRLSVTPKLEKPIIEAIKEFCVGHSNITLSATIPTSTSSINAGDVYWYNANIFTNDNLIGIGSSINYALSMQTETLYAVVRYGTNKSETSQIVVKLRPELTYNNNTLTATQVPGASYRWFYNNELLKETTTNSIDIGSNYGIYYVSLLLDECTSTSLVYTVTADAIITSIGVETAKEEASIALWPNPAKEELNLSFTDENNSSFAIEIYDISGRKTATYEYTKTENNFKTTIATNDYKAGIYILKLISNNKTIVKRFVIR